MKIGLGIGLFFNKLASAAAPVTSWLWGSSVGKNWGSSSDKNWGS